MDSPCARCRCQLDWDRWPKPEEAPHFCPSCRAIMMAAQDVVATADPQAWAEIDHHLRTFRNTFGAPSLLKPVLGPDFPADFLEDVAKARLGSLMAQEPESFAPRRFPDPEAILSKVKALQPVAIEALWDGDTSGWFLKLRAVLSESRCQSLAVLQRGGDGRLFTGDVPPWPEAEFARTVGERLTAELGLPFYFPSPHHPEDECPDWWQRDEGSPCRSCGIPLLQESDHPWRGLCGSCHTDEKLACQAEQPPAPPPVRPRMTILRVKEFFRVVVLTGAGLSTASGLPTFRGPDGRRTTPDLEALENMRELARRAQPNPAHFALAKLERDMTEREGRFLLVTQNIDGLHQLAGSQNVEELHGNIHRVRCSDPACPWRASAESYAPGQSPCELCGGPIRPDVVMIGEAIAGEVEYRIKRALRECHLFLAIGTSGSVAPASHFAYSARFHKARTALLNLEFRGADIAKYDECYAGRAEQVLPHLFGG